jgi:hypothetical protein
MLCRGMSLRGSVALGIPRAGAFEPAVANATAPAPFVARASGSVDASASGELSPFEVLAESDVCYQAALRTDGARQLRSGVVVHTEAEGLGIVSSRLVTRGKQASCSVAWK